MNRKIKFRGKNHITGEWHYGYYFSDGKDHFIYHPIDGGLYGTSKVLRDTIGMLTNLIDKYGNDIYEHDICQSPFSEKVKYMVEYYVDGFKVKNMVKTKRYNFGGGYQTEKTPHKSNYSDWGKMEVLGNIHDNPEMLT